MSRPERGDKIILFLSYPDCEGMQRVEIYDISNDSNLLHEYEGTDGVIHHWLVTKNQV